MLRFHVVPVVGGRCGHGNGFAPYARKACVLFCASIMVLPTHIMNTFNTRGEHRGKVIPSGRAYKKCMKKKKVKRFSNGAQATRYKERGRSRTTLIILLFCVGSYFFSVRLLLHNLGRFAFLLTTWNILFVCFRDSSDFIDLFKFYRDRDSYKLLFDEWQEIYIEPWLHARPIIIYVNHKIISINQIIISKYTEHKWNRNANYNIFFLQNMKICYCSINYFEKI